MFCCNELCHYDLLSQYIYIYIYIYICIYIYILFISLQHRTLYLNTYVGFIVACNVNLPYRQNSVFFYSWQWCVDQEHTYDASLCFHCNSGYANVPRCYVIRTLYILFEHPFLDQGMNTTMLPWYELFFVWNLTLSMRMNILTPLSALSVLVSELTLERLGWECDFI